MIELNVKNQKLQRVDKFSPATDSVDYLTVKFNFLTNDWNGKAKVALFRVDTAIYEAVVYNNSCLVPYEVLTATETSKLNIGGAKNRFYLSVYGTQDATRITTNEIKVELNLSGYGEGQTPATPTADVYEQLLTAYAESQKRCETEALNNKKLYANAIKGVASGETLTLDDVSPIEHKVNIKVYGKNLIPYPYANANKTANGVTISTEKDGGVTFSGTPTSYVGLHLANITDIPKSKLLYMSIVGECSNVILQATFYDDNGTNIGTTATSNKKTIDMTNYTNVAQITIEVKRSVDGVETSGTVYPMFSMYDVEYTPYIDPSTVTLTKTVDEVTESYTPNTDGTVDGVTLVENATLTTDTEGITIECEYIRDTNKVIEKLTNAIVALGGTV